MADMGWSMAKSSNASGFALMGKIMDLRRLFRVFWTNPYHSNNDQKDHLTFAG